MRISTISGSTTPRWRIVERSTFCAPDRACGSAQSGLVEVGAYPIAVHRDGAATLVLEMSDVKRAPLHRALMLLEIEARRYGARLGIGALLSDAPLDMFLDTLAARMALPVNAAQVIETHVPASQALS